MARSRSCVAALTLPGAIATCFVESFYLFWDFELMAPVAAAPDLGTIESEDGSFSWKLSSLRSIFSMSFYDFA